MTNSWKNGPHYIFVQPTEVIIGSNPGNSGHTDNATALRHEEFLNGAFHDHIKQYFSANVLEEVISAVNNR